MDNWIELMIQQRKYPTFKREYERAVSEARDTFIFDDQYVLTAFAKYVCEYVESESE